MQRSLIAAALALAFMASATPAVASKANASSVVTEFCGDRYGKCFDAADAAAAKPVVRKRAHAKNNGTTGAKAAVAPVAEPTFRAGTEAVAAAAERYVGGAPSVNDLKEWARETGIGVWRFGQRLYCALGVNKALADAGIPGTASGLARSFRQWGKPTKFPQRGDIAVVGAHHVAVVVGRTAAGVEVVSFNDARHEVRRVIYPLRGVQYRAAAN